MGTPVKTQDKKPSGGAIKDLGGKRVANPEGAPPTSKDKDPYALEGVADVEVAPHLGDKEGVYC